MTIVTEKYEEEPYEAARHTCLECGRKGFTKEFTSKEGFLQCPKCDHLPKIACVNLDTGKTRNAPIRM